MADKEIYHAPQLSKPLRFSIGILLAIVALNAFAGGFYGMSGAKNVPAEWLKGTPFSSYFIPSLFLFLIVGGSSLFAAIAVLKKHPLGTNIAYVSASVIILWLIIQVIMIGYVSWMQPATAIVALLIIFLTTLTSAHAV